ncbi:unnamed protein product [Allacma fusca]|uniref:Uncharacterized protein n=1 Tax=Allacma fusca TaxID=39272 RepID=A0A8J2JL79_9HEXA|nr:unnamed protein product [Allacma fusca]
MRTFWITDVLCNVITNNKNTLRVLKLQIVRCDEDECVLSGILLSELVCLEEFKLEGDALTNNALTLTDFAWLPKSLTKILTMFMRIEETDFTCIHEFKSLKYIELNHIVMGHHDEINLENNTSSIFASILEQLLRHRELDHLGVSLSRSVNSCEKLKNFMERISEASTTPNHQDNEMPNYYGLVIAHQYEIDDKFDLYKSTNRESIFSDDFVFQIRPKKDTVSLVEVRVEVERRDNVDYFEEELTEDNFATSDLTSEGSSGMPSLTPLHLSSDWDEMDPAQGIIMPPDPDEDIS